MSNDVQAIEVTVRRAEHGDETALLRLAALDSAAPLAGDVLMAEVGGKPTAAISLADGRVVADPFERTADLVDLLRMRAGQLRPATGRVALRPQPAHSMANQT